MGHTEDQARKESKMAQCELCGKVVRTTQGLRGHKTFVHGIHANRSKPIVALTDKQSMDEVGNHIERASVSDYMDRLNKLKSEVVSNTELLAELRRTVRALQNQLVLKANASDINLIATKVESLIKHVEKHEKWFNPKSIDEVVLDFCGGPIAGLEKRLDRLQSIVTARRKGSV
jgi:uncharacterized C2H2 Zn-finger protein